KSNTSTSATASVTFPGNGTSAGIYTVLFSGISVSSAGNAYQNYTFTVFVSPAGLNAAPAPGAAAKPSPHPGHFVVYWDAPGGGTSEDPAIDYESVGYEPILNVYQTLVSYNGSLTGPTYQSFVPELATCVPGSPACSALYSGNNLINGVNYTFVINSKSQFYDPATGNHWGVYPTDVVFSIARTIGFADLPCWSCNNGWILSQAVAPEGSLSWDAGIHYPGNNTPSAVFSHVLVNDTAAGCPTFALSNPADNGCVTFVANGTTQANWPFFLELLADPLGASIVPAGWFSAGAQAAGIPGWTYGTVGGSGDGPVTLPGGYTSSSATFLAYIAANMAPTSWDTWEKAGSAPPYWGNVQYEMVGSGPYYMEQYSPGNSYLLAANPAYAQNPYCTWSECQPVPGAYVPSVSVTWETSQLPGEEAYASGTADFAGIPSTDTALAIQLVQQGKISITAFPTISIDFFPYNLAFNIQAAKSFDTSPITIPSDFFSYDAARQFFSHAYPYTTVENTINTVDGLQDLFPQSGAIPQFMANYYAANVTWPTGDPGTSPTQVGSAAWWWAQATTNTSSPYYDPEMAACSPSSPCEFPVVGQLGSPQVDEIYGVWASEVNTLTKGAVKMDVVDLTFLQEVIYSLFSGPYQNPMPFFVLAWGPDYPDPTDYVAPMYKADGSYTASDTVWEQLSSAGPGNSSFWTASCPTADVPPNALWGATPNSLNGPISNLVTWARLAGTGKGAGTPGIPTSCQGGAYAEMNWAMAVAAQLAAGPERVLVYNLVSQIASALSLYTWIGQVNQIVTYAPWINPATFDTNVILLGGNFPDTPWFDIGGTGVL
ncbi:MAG: hypothetical protein WCA77_03450, partial [Thermoplasmata archaeon]